MAGLGDATLRRCMIRAGRDLYRQGMLAGASGNLSARLGGERILITASGTRKGRMRPDDLLLLDLAGNLISGTGRPSSESDLHLAIYRRFAGVGAVVHAHPIKATALAAAHHPISVDSLAEALFVLGAVPLVPYIPTGDPALGETVAAALTGADAALLLNHGAITIAPSVAAAVSKMEVLEALAQTVVSAHILGGTVTLPRAEIERLRRIWRERRNV